jgi:hypothetical protein
MMENSRWGGGRGRPSYWRHAICLLPLWIGVLAVAATAEPKFTFVDLQPKANHKLADDLGERAGNNLANVPQGEQKLGDVSFRIGEKMIRLRGIHAADLPEKVEGIPAEATFDRLHILHATRFGEDVEKPVPDGTEIGAYVVHYADKSVESIPIRYGEELRDWWDHPERPDAKNARIAWSGTNPVADQFMHKIRLFAMVWTNPHPEKPVSAIDFVSNGGECDPFLVALTLEKK